MSLALATILGGAVTESSAAGQTALQAFAGVGGLRRDFGGAAGGVELQLGEGFRGLRPAIGLLAERDGGVFGYLGLRRDFDLRHVRISPMAALGDYERRRGFELGGPLQFRTGLEISIPFGQGGRVGLLVYHLSNGGIEELNPGTESLVVTVTQDLRRRR